MDEKVASIKDAAEAVKGVVEAIPVYQDAIQPAAKEVGQALATVAKTIHIVLAPVSAMVWGYDQLKDFLSTTVASKLSRVPPERLIAPAPHVAGPALEALRYVGHDSHLRDLYANLLATSLDADTTATAHPSFVEIIKNLSPDEARLLKGMSQGDSFPLIDVQARLNDGTGFITRVRNFSLLGQLGGCEHLTLVQSYLDNLARLGVCEIRADVHITGPDVYKPLKEAAELKPILEEIVASGMATVGFQDKLLAITTFGRQFINACVIDRAPQVSTTAP